jgi:hypothetical protein
MQSNYEASNVRAITLTMPKVPSDGFGSQNIQALFQDSQDFI